MSERSQVAKAAGVVGGVTMISRVFGYARDFCIAMYFGAGTSADAFFVAFRIPNFLRRLFGEGSLTISFVPIFTEALEKKGPERAKELASICFTVFSAILALVTVLGVVFAPQIIMVLAPGYQGVEQKSELTVFLTRVMFPYTLLICLVALAMGVLNSLKHFFAPAFAPVLLNIAMILAAVTLSSVVDPPVLALAIGVVAGGVLQLILQVPFLAKKGYLPKFNFKPKDPDLRRIAILMLPAMFGMAVHTVAVFINTVFASLLSEGAVSYLFFADRIMELPLGVFAIAVGTAVLPSMSRQTAANDIEGLKDTMSYAMRLVIFIALPATAGLIALDLPIVNLLFQHGQFTREAAEATAVALLYFCMGLPFFSALRVIVPTFYAMKDTLTPVLLAAAALGTTIICDVLFVGPLEYRKIEFLAMMTEKLNISGPLGHGGLALATSVGAAVNCIGLMIILKRRIGKIGGAKIAATFLRSLVGSLAMGVAVWYLATRIDFTSSGFTTTKILAINGCVIVGILIYGLFSYFTGSKELLSIIDIIKARLKKRPR